MSRRRLRVGLEHLWMLISTIKFTTNGKIGIHEALGFCEEIKMTKNPMDFGEAMGAAAKKAAEVAEIPKIPTPAEVQHRLETAWSENARALLERCVRAIHQASSLTISVEPRAESAEVRKRVEIELAKHGWSITIVGDERDSSYVITPNKPAGTIYDR